MSLQKAKAQRKYLAMNGAHTAMLKLQEEADSLSPRTRGTKLQKLDHQAAKLLDAQNAKPKAEDSRFVPTDAQKWETGGFSRSSFLNKTRPSNPGLK